MGTGEQVMTDWTQYSPGNHRTTCPVCVRKPNEKTLSITIACEGHGVAHCFRCGYVETRQRQRDLTPAERAGFKRRNDALRRQHATEQRQRKTEAAVAAFTRWSAACAAEVHPYLTAKGVRAHGLRIEARYNLLIPMRDIQGHLHSLQAIAPNGTKLFMPNGRVTGCYHAMGRPSDNLVICEGYATGATIYEDAGTAVAVAFNAGNLLSVAKALRLKFPCITIVIAADDDWKTPGNPGLTAATEAARVIGGKLAVPNFGGLPRGEKDTDFNDLARLSRAQEMET